MSLTRLAEYFYNSIVNSQVHECDHLITFCQYICSHTFLRRIHLERKNRAI